MTSMSVLECIQHAPLTGKLATYYNALHLTPTASSQALHTIGGNSIHIV